MSNELPDDLCEILCDECEIPILYSEAVRSQREYAETLCPDCQKKAISKPF